MSGIAGIFNRNGEQINPGLLESMTKAVSYRGPDGIGSWIDGSLGVSQLLLATTPESVNECRPMLDDDSGFCIVFDGRVDNRQELTDALKSHGIHCRNETDMELVLKSYEVWGCSCPTKILGDFAFAIWNRKKQQLFCARDIQGFRPFHYSVAPDHFYFGSELCQIIRCPGVTNKVNLDMVAQYLATAIHNFDETLYADIKRLPPAHYLLIDREKLSIRRYWDLAGRTSLRYKREADYVDHYLEILETAVECRLRCLGKVGASMSGGLDSTSIVGMAQKLYAKQGQTKSITTFSTTFPGRACDEAEQIDLMVQHSGVESFIFRFTSFEQEPDWQDQVRSSFELPDSPLATVDTSSLREAQSRHIRVMLDGTGADANLGGSSYPYLQAFMRGRIAFLLNFFQQQASDIGWKSATAKLLRSLCWPMTPKSLRKVLASHRPPIFKTYLLRQEFLSSIGFHEKKRNLRNDWRFSDLAQWHHHRFAFDAYNRFELEAFERQHARFGIEQRHPFCDRRMMEFGFAVPDFRKLQKNVHKSLVLEGSRELIPQRLQVNPNFGHFSNCFQETLKLPVVSQIFRSLELANLGVVSGEKVLQEFAGVMERSGSGLEIHCDDYGRLLPLISVLSMEYWIREAKSHGSPFR